MTAGTVRRTAAQAIVNFLAVQHSERDGRRRRLIPGMFGIFGHGNVHGLGQALLETDAELPFLPARSEQGMVHVAAAYAKSERRLATYACASSIGPGATNMITGAALATVNRLPVLLLPADYFARRQQGTVLQQLEHPTGGDVSVNDCFRAVSRYFDRITHPEQLLSALPEACRVLTSPSEAGAVVLSLPQDVQAEAYDFPREFFEPRTWPVLRQPPPPEQVRVLAELIGRSERPVIVAGGGVVYSEAEDELRALAARCGIPVTETFAGKGAMRSRGWPAIGGMGTSGNPAANELLRTADLVLCLGTRLTDTQTGSRTLFQRPDARFVAVNTDARDAHKEGALPIVGDLRETLRALLAVLGESGYTTQAAYREHALQLCAGWEEHVANRQPSRSARPLSQPELVTTLNGFASSGDIVIGAAGTLPTDLLRLWDASGGRDCYLEFGFSCMTHEIPAGIGARLSRPRGEVYVLVGDGSFLMNPSEIFTAVQLGLKITILVVENHRFQSIFGLQQRTAGEGDIGNEFVPLDPFTGRRVAGSLTPDLVQIARGLGAEACRVEREADLLEAIARARADTRTHVVVVAVDSEAPPLPGSGAWRDIPPAEVASDPAAARRRAEYLERAASRRRHP